MSPTFKSKTRWREKLEKPQEPRLVTVPPKMAVTFGTGQMLIPTPMLVDGVMRKVARGKLVTVGQIRRRLAWDYEADVTCPLTTGIFVRIAAETAEEDRLNGRKRITPYWRVVKDDGSLNPKFPGGVGQQARYLRSEGLAITRQRKRTFVKDFEKSLAVLK